MMIADFPYYAALPKIVKIEFMSLPGEERFRASGASGFPQFLPQPNTSNLTSNSLTEVVRLS
ncbi:MAG: hypothetical protein ACRCT1_02550 [Microcoleaceae cyanobacterium]